MVRPQSVDMFRPNIDRIRNEFFKKSISVGHHNIKYSWMQIMLMIMSCIKGLESFETGAKCPSPQTLRDRLNLKGCWLEFFHERMFDIAKWSLKVYSRFSWYLIANLLNNKTFLAAL